MAVAIDVPAVRRRQAEATGAHRIGLGFSIFCEQAAHGTSVYAGWGIPMIPGFEQAVARMTPDGGLELRVGIQSHGQGLETTLAQVAHEILGIPLPAIRVVHGDTAMTPYSTGTWGSRCMVMAGGAVATACTELSHRIARIGAHLLQVPIDSVQVGNGIVAGPAGEVTLTDVARTWYLRPQDLPEDVAPGGLEVTSGYKPLRDSGTFSYAAHAAVVEVDTELGGVRILDYAVCEDGGKLINPMIVDGQVLGGAAQGIGTALYEEMPYDIHGQPGAATLADYILPGATEVPDIRIDHMETPSPLSFFGQKGIGEGGAIGPPAAIANAVNDALAPLGVEITALPITPTAHPRRPARAGHVKPAPFDLLRPASVADAVTALAQGGPEACVLSGGQSLGPMLNLRVVQPKLLVQVNHLPDLAGVAEAPDAITLGACVTHAAIAGGRTPDLADGWLAGVAGAIAYQAVRNRGTIGGSLCHADPAADWVVVLMALDAAVTLRSSSGVRRVAVSDFITGAVHDGAGCGRNPDRRAHSVPACRCGLALFESLPQARRIRPCDGSRADRRHDTPADDRCAGRPPAAADRRASQPWKAQA